MRSYKAGNGEVCFSFDDYDPQNIRIEKILHEEGIEATFFIETARPEGRAQIQELFNLGHDIGSHTIHHPPDLKRLHQVEAMSEIEGSKKMIETMIGRPCNVIAYPRGRHNDDIVAMVKRAGYEEARTTHVLKTRWEDNFRIPTTIHYYPNRKEYNGRPLEVLIPFYLDDVMKNGGTFHLWGHAAEIERNLLWPQFEESIKFIAKHIEV